MKNILKILIVLVIIFIIAIFLPLDFLTNIKRPFISIADDLSDSFRSVFNGGEIAKENDRLLFQNNSLKSIVIENISLQEENDFLRNMLGIQKDSGFELILADIISRPFLNFSYDLIINKGEDDGIKVGQPVIWGGKTIIGGIKEVEENKSKIEVVSDDDFRAAVFVGDRKIEAIFEGGGLSRPFLDMISNQSEVKKGDMVFTSGLDQKFPKNLYLGEVVEIEKKEGQAFYKAIVEVAFDWADLKQVFVISN